MNENPEGTPNPLNPNPLDANPAEPISDEAEVNISETTNTAFRGQSTRGVGQYTRTMYNKTPRQTSQPLTEELVQESVMVESLDPDGRPMEQVVQPQPQKKKKKTGLIVGLIVCLFIAVGCGVVAILMMLNGEKDSVSLAMKKLMSGEAPNNVVVDGDIELQFNDTSSPVSKINIDLNSEVQINPIENSATADITLTASDGEKISLKLNEVYTKDGDLYLKLDETPALLEKVDLLKKLLNGETETVCLNEETCDAFTEQAGTDYLSRELSNIVELIDEKWLKVSIDQAELLSGLTTENNFSCLKDFVDDINKNSSSALELYNKNTFIGSTTNNIPISNKLSPVHKITFDDEAMANFINAVQNSTLTTELYDCLGWNNNARVSAKDVAEAIRNFPALYVEVDKDNNFSRLYTKYNSEDGMMTATIDLSFKYPTNINVSEPDEYTPLEDVMRQLFMNLYNVESTTIIEEEGTEAN